MAEDVGSTHTQPELTLKTRTPQMRHLTGDTRAPQLSMPDGNVAPLLGGVRGLRISEQETKALHVDSELCIRCEAVKCYMPRGARKWIQKKKS